MRIEQLQAFIAVAETGNFGQAALQCGVTQSTVSRQIQSLESDLGSALLHRTAQSKLTVAGESLLPRALKICQEWQIATQEIASLLAGEQPELCVATIPSVCAYYLPIILQDFCRTYPQVQLRVTALGSDRALKVLRDGLVDVAVIMNPRFLQSSSEIVVTDLYEEPVEVLMAADHPLAQYDQVPWSDVVRYPQLLFKDGYGMQRLVKEWFTQHSVPLQAAMELNTLGAFRGVIRQGEILALLPHSALLEARQDTTLAVRPIAEAHHNGTAAAPISLRRKVVMVTTSDRLHIPPIYHFCQLIKNCLKPDVPEVNSLVSQ